MKILQVTPTYPPAWAYGGISRMVYEITLELCKQGHEVEVWTSDAFDLHSRVKNVDLKTARAGAKVCYFKNLSFALTRLFNIHLTPGIFLSANRKLCSFDIVHLHGARTLLNLVLYPYLKRYSVPYVLEAHGSLPRVIAKQRLKWIYDAFLGYRLLRDASKVIALSQTEAQQYVDMGVPEEKIEIIPNGIDLSEYVDLPLKGTFKKKFNIPYENKIILYLGRIHKTKGIDFLVRTYAYLTNDIKFNEITLVIAGSDDGYFTEAKKLVGLLKISDKVVFTGMLSEKEKLSAYVDSTICTYLGINEPFGLVPLEAVACMTPVIVCNGTPMSSIVNNGKFGFSVKYGDINELAEIMKKMLNDDELLREMGEKGQKFVFENFNWTKIITKFEKVYEQAVAC